MPKKLDFKNLRFCLDNYTPIHLLIRDCGGYRENGKFSSFGQVKVSEDLEGKTLDFKKNKKGLFILIDKNEVFHFPLEDYIKGFSLGYKRIEETDDGIGRSIYAKGIDPYDPALPEPNQSILRTVLDDHLMEISFPGRVNLKLDSWKKNRFIPKYWNIDKPHNIIQTIRKQQEEYGEEDRQ